MCPSHLESTQIPMNQDPMVKVPVVEGQALEAQATSQIWVVLLIQ